MSQTLTVERLFEHDADSNCTAIFHQALYGPPITNTWTNGDPCDGAHTGITCAPFAYVGITYNFVTAM